MSNEKKPEQELTEAELEQVKGGALTSDLPKITAKISKESHGSL